MDNNISGEFTRWMNPFFNDSLKNNTKNDPKNEVSVNSKINQENSKVKITEDVNSSGNDYRKKKNNNNKRVYPKEYYVSQVSDHKKEEIDLTNSSLKKSMEDKTEFSTSNPKFIRSNPKKSSISLKKELIIRITHLVAGIGSFLTGGIDVAIAGFPAIFVLGNAFLSNFSWKCIPFSNNAFFQTQKFLRGSATLLSRCYEHALKVLSPRAEFPGNSFSLSLITNEDSAIFLKEGNGLLTNHLIQENKLTFLQKSANNCINSKNILIRQIMSRVNYLGLAMLVTLTRTFDAFVGVIAAPLSFVALLFGGSSTLNNLAFRGLQAPAIINDLFYCTVKFIDPLAGTNYVTVTEKNKDYVVKANIKEITCSSYFKKGEKNYINL